MSPAPSPSYSTHKREAPYYRRQLDELKLQIDGERELEETLRDVPDEPGAPMPGSREQHEQFDNFVANVLRGSEDGVSASNAWRQGTNTWRVPFDEYANAIKDWEVQQGIRAATGQAAGPSNVYHAGLSGYVRAMPVLGMLGVGPDMVPYGEALVGWITSEGAAENVAEDTSLPQMPANATTFDKQTFEPIRTRADRSWTGEANLSTDQALPSTFVGEMLAALADGWEKQVLAGDGVSPNFPGLFGASIQKRAALAAADTATTIAAAVQSLVDGIYAATKKDIRCVMSGDASAWLAAAPAALVGATAAMSMLDWLSDRLGAVRVSAHAPGVDTTGGGTNRAHKLLFRVGNKPGAFAWPMWSSGEMKTDDTSDAGTRVVMQSYSNFLAAGAAQGRKDWQNIELRESA